MISSIKPAGSLDPVTNAVMLIYGSPGVGKTTFALSAERVLLLEFDHRGQSRSVLGKRVDAWKPKTIAQLVDFASAQTQAQLGDYGTIVVDTIGSLQAWIIEQMSSNRKFVMTDGKVTLDGYGEITRLVNLLTRGLVACGKHVVYVAHCKEQKSRSNEQASKLQPAITGIQCYNGTMQLCDMVGYMQAATNGTTVISFSPNADYDAKNTAGIAPFVVPNYGNGTAGKDTMQTLLDLTVAKMNERDEQATEMIAAQAEVVRLLSECRTLAECYHVLEEPRSITTAQVEAMVAKRQIELAVGLLEAASEAKDLDSFVGQMKANLVGNARNYVSPMYKQACERLNVVFDQTNGKHYLKP